MLASNIGIPELSVNLTLATYFQNLPLSLMKEAQYGVVSIIA
jgi:hypothetical protein